MWKQPASGLATPDFLSESLQATSNWHLLMLDTLPPAACPHRTYHTATFQHKNHNARRGLPLGGMKFAQLVIGPAGCGKSTFCDAIQQHCRACRRSIHIMNLGVRSSSVLSSMKACITLAAQIQGPSSDCTCRSGSRRVQIRGQL